MADKRKWIVENAMTQLRLRRIMKAYMHRMRNSSLGQMRLAPIYVDYSAADSNTEPQPAHVPVMNQAPAEGPSDPTPGTSAGTGGSVATLPPRSAHPDPDAIPSSTSATPPGTPLFLPYMRMIPSSLYRDEVIVIEDSDDDDEAENEDRGPRGRNAPDNRDEYYNGPGPSRGFAHNKSG